MARAVIAVVSPQAMLDDQANGYLPDNIEVDMGEDPNTIVINGERDVVFRFLIDDLGVDPKDANEYIDHEEGTSEEEAGESEEEEAAEEAERQRDYHADMKTDQKRYGEGVQDFDKYMDQILIKEGHGRPPVKPEDNPQRRRAARHQDRPNNKIRYGVK